MLQEASVWRNLCLLRSHSDPTVLGSNFAAMFFGFCRRKFAWMFRPRTRTLSQRIADLWGRLTRRIMRVRFKMRLWGYLGHLLQEFNPNLRARLSQYYPSGFAQRRAGLN